MDPQTIIKVANGTMAVLVGTMVGTAVFCEIQQRQLNRSMAQLDQSLAYGRHLMKNWRHMPPQ